jgi:phosphoribosylanthranilate isomerase
VIRAVTEPRRDLLSRLPADVILLSDEPKEGRCRGGSRGQRWRGAAALARKRRLLLAGGLDERNVAEAVETVRPFGVDVCSGVETGPGRKDHARTRRFVEAARRALEGSA